MLALGVLVACTGGRVPKEGGVREGQVVVEHKSEYRETDYTIAEGDCRIKSTRRRPTAG